MKIVIDATAAISGGKLYLEKLLPQLAGTDARTDVQHEFIIFHTGDLDQLAATLSGERFQFHRIAIPIFNRRESAAASVMKLLWRKFALPGHLRKLAPDLLFSNSGTVPASKPAKTKVLIALHNCMPLSEMLIAEERSMLRRWRLKLLRRQMQQALQTCDGSIAFSQDTVRQIRESFGQLQQAPSVVYHAIDWGERERKIIADVDDVTRRGIAQPYLIYVSQFHRYKNVLRLLEAFAVVAEKHPQLSLVLVGAAADGDYWNEVTETIERLDLGERVIDLPACPRDQLIALYRGALAFVQPSLAETCSFPLLEALALGVPAAVAKMSALPEMAGDAAIYFNPYSVDEMADALDRLVWDEALRGELNRRGIEQAARFTWDETARKTLAVFEQFR